MHYLLIIFLPLTFMQLLFLRKSVELNEDWSCSISGFRRDINDIWAILELLLLLDL